MKIKIFLFPRIKNDKITNKTLLQQSNKTYQKGIILFKMRE